jgi:hypothetical protein
LSQGASLTRPELPKRLGFPCSFHAGADPEPCRICPETHPNVPKWLTLSLRHPTNGLCGPAQALCASTHGLCASTEELRAGTEKRRAGTEERRASTEERRASTEERRASTEKRRASTEKRRADTEKRRADTEKRRASTEKLCASTEERRASTEERRASSEKRRASTEERRASTAGWWDRIHRLAAGVTFPRGARTLSPLFQAADRSVRAPFKIRPTDAPARRSTHLPHQLLHLRIRNGARKPRHARARLPCQPGVIFECHASAHGVSGQDQSAAGGRV